VATRQLKWYRLLTQQNTVLNTITEFTAEYRTVISGTATDISGDELSGGARIGFVFNEIYGQAIRSLDPFDQIKDLHIRTILYNSSVSFFSKSGLSTVFVRRHGGV
jgi:vacuolar protein sorting-associated protein 1